MVPRPGVAERPLSTVPNAVLVKVSRRRAEFPSRAAALEHWCRAGGYAGWRDASLAAFGEYGLVERDGAVHLRCRPETEAAMLRPIFHVMEQSYPRSEVFGAFQEVSVPVCIADCSSSEPVYAPMVAAARELIPSAQHLTFPTGHCVAQQNPDTFTAAVLDFAG